MIMKFTQKRLKEILYYAPDTGIFIWLVRTACRVHIGDTAGSINDGGYIKISICDVKYQAHRLAWLYMTGEWPEYQIDHRNGIRNDNRWKNLREATHSINTQNLHKARSDNKIGLLGVSRSGKKFIALIQINKKQIYLGTYLTQELAHSAYLKAKRELHA